MNDKTLNINFLENNQRYKCKSSQILNLSNDLNIMYV